MATKKKTSAKKAPVKKAAVKKPAAKKDVKKKVTAKKLVAKKVTSKKAAVRNAAVKKPTAKRVVRPTAVIDTQRAVEQFLYRQSEILDTRQWQSFIDLFSADGVYWMPITQEQTEWEGSPSIFAEDKLMMEVRMRRVLHPQAWSQSPMWATNHLVSNVVIEKETAGEVQVRSRFHLMELRRDTVRHFGGTYRHTLVKSGAGYKIKLQRVDMFNSQAPYDYVLQIWV
ncbi:MAG: putative aromatic-ring-hydroxylating dioxygenase, beta subunit [Betaproteobacteria bacterium]|nr:putative aromatic-ring-hydroxylating dioxygenase, beta subunit [Betaproteobacteria bacterium]